MRRARDRRTTPRKCRKTWLLRGGVRQHSTIIRTIQLKCAGQCGYAGNELHQPGSIFATFKIISISIHSNLSEQLPLKKDALSNISADCERYIGTQGGGMDQAIAFLAQEGCAQFIDWNPLRATPIKLPQNAYFVIANSLTRANKAATSDFNHRVIECRLACRIIAKRLNQSWREFDRFASLQQALNCSLNEFESFANQILHEEIYTRDDVISALEIDEFELENYFLTANTRHIQKFKLRQRALHVIQGEESSEKLRAFQHNFKHKSFHLFFRIHSSRRISSGGRLQQIRRRFVEINARIAS